MRFLSFLFRYKNRGILAVLNFLAGRDGAMRDTRAQAPTRLRRIDVAANMMRAAL